MCLDLGTLGILGILGITDVVLPCYLINPDFVFGNYKASLELLSLLSPYIQVIKLIKRSHLFTPI